MNDVIDGFREYPNDWGAETRFMNCLLHYADQRKGKGFASVRYEISQISMSISRRAIIVGKWGRVQRHVRFKNPEVWIEEDSESRSCTATDIRWPILGSPVETIILTVPTDKKKPDKQVQKLLDAVQLYFATLRG
jgi:hypothetical protein